MTADPTATAVQALADQLLREADDPTTMPHEGLVQAARVLRQFAARLAQEAQTCETCRFAGQLWPNEPNWRICNLPDTGRTGNHYGVVPLTVNGQPFGCRGWTAKDRRTP